MLEISSSADAQQMWRSIFATLIALGGIFLAFAFLFPVQDPQMFLPYFAIYILFFAGLIFFIVIYEWLYIWMYFYDIGPDFLRIRKGVVIRQEISVPYNRIQDVNIDQDFLDRLFILYDVHIATAAQASEEEAHIDGVNHENAEKIHELILQRIKEASEPKTAPGV